MAALNNQRHERFAQELAQGKSATVAMAVVGYSDPRNSTRLTKKEEIAARVAELKQMAAERIAVTVEDIARQLDMDREFARQCGSASAAMAATMGKAKLLGLIVHSHEHSGKDGGPIEVERPSNAKLAQVLISAFARK